MGRESEGAKDRCSVKQKRRWFLNKRFAPNQKRGLIRAALSFSRIPIETEKSSKTGRDRKRSLTKK